MSRCIDRTATCVIYVLLVLIMWGMLGHVRAQTRHSTTGDVWIVFFSSAGCPRCSGVMRLIATLAEQYPVRLKAYDIDNPADYELFHTLESIHSDREFAVPLVIVGDRILMGQTEIERKLERITARLARSGGAPLPYLGPRSDPDTSGGRDPSDCNCDDGRPPTLREEWTKVRDLIDRLIE